VVAQIFTWRTVDNLGVITITNRLNADPAAYPSPKPGGWNSTTVYALLGNPKYTGHMVYGRRRSTGRRRFHTVPQDQWIWSPEPTHPAIINRATWDTAQAIGSEHASARDDTEPSTHPAARRSYLLRSRCRCRDCKRRMTGRLGRPYPGHPGYIYYNCPHNPLNPRHQAAVPDHPRTVRVREDDLLTVIHQFFATRIFSPDRVALLAERLPASAAEDTPAASRKPPGCTNASRRSTPPRTPTPAKSNTWPPCRRARRQSPRCERGSSPGSPNWRPNAPRSTSGLPPSTAPPANTTTLHSWTLCRCSATPCPACPPASMPGYSPPSAWN
jgi:Recombinase/Recombinase zinc beta ribbon domain